MRKGLPRIAGIVPAFVVAGVLSVVSVSVARGALSAPASAQDPIWGALSVDSDTPGAQGDPIWD